MQLNPSILFLRHAALLKGFFRLASALLLVLSPDSRLLAEDKDPFQITPSLVASNGAVRLDVVLAIAPHHHLYKDKLVFEIGRKAMDFTLPAALSVTDRFGGGQKQVFEGTLTASHVLSFAERSEHRLDLTFQGCNEEECFFPQTRSWLLRSDLSVLPLKDEVELPAVADALGLPDGFKVVARTSGYLTQDRFLRFLDQKGSDAVEQDELSAALVRFGAPAALGLILLGGLALNLTPCVLPMIPINLAILGTGPGRNGRRRGFLLGAAYGSGMALTYGSLGVGVVLTGAKFGSLNSSPGFNIAMAVVFIVLSLGMFDMLSVDLSRFRRKHPGLPGVKQGALLGAVVMGSISALLAGACVAPVLISVLLLATREYQGGNWLGLMLPFLLGLGMAIPWPFAAAGLSFLPKPGMWMDRVKQGFGVIILGFAAYYGWLGYSLFERVESESVSAAAGEAAAKEFRAALASSTESGRPVLVDFWASWCKNCTAMKHSTLASPVVKGRLKDFVFLPFQVEHLQDRTVKPLLDQLGVLGLPTYVLIVPTTREPVDTNPQPLPLPANSSLKSPL